MLTPDQLESRFDVQEPDAPAKRADVPLLTQRACVIGAVLSILLSASSAAHAQDASDVGNVIVPFIESHCVHCHGEENPKGDMSLSAFKDEASILQARKTWIRVLEQLGSGEMPPKERPRPAFDDVERFTKAVRGVFERFDRTAPRDPGVVTMRRLNRAEYINTVRDLVGVTIPLAEDFPADQIGYGFDNIGDILTLSPLQLERYLASAEAIVKAAIVIGEPPKPSKQSAAGVHGFKGTHYGPNYDDRGRLARDTEGTMIPEKDRLPAFPGDGWRVFYAKGPFHKRFDQLVDRGEYKLVARLQGLFVGDEPPKFALVVDGKEVLRGVCTEQAEEYSVAVRLAPGAVTLGVSLLNEFTDPADSTKRRGIVLHSLTLVSPTIPESHEKLFAGSEKLTGDAKSRFVLERFASRAFRRPVTKDEVDRLMQIVEQAEQIHWYKLSEQAFSRYREAKLDGDVIVSLGHLEKADFMDEEQFVHYLRKRLSEDQLKAHRESILAGADQIPQPWEARIALAMRAILASPKFLYRAELDSQPTEEAPHPIDDYQLASRLSYFLWSTMPDQELFDLAAKKQLHQNLPAQVKRMLADPRSQALFENFATQWLGLRRLGEFTPDPNLLPDLSRLGAGGRWADLQADMLTETRMFFMEIVREDRSIIDLIDAKFSYVNQRLAMLYDIGDTNGNSAQPKVEPINPPGKPIPYIEVFERGQDEGTVVRTHNPFVRVNLENTRRGGLLTQASVLTVTSHPTRTSPVKRGHWVLERLLGTPPPPPPPDVPELAAKQEAKPATLRQQMEQHRANPNCAGCHARMDPIGFAFENFDLFGRFRETDGDLPIDPSGELPGGGQKFEGPDGLKEILKSKKELFSRNLTEKLLIYATGRGLDFYDRPTVDGIMSELEKNDYRFHALVTAVVQSDAFRMRRGKN